MKGAGSTGSELRQVRQHVRSLLAKLRRDIRGKEAELARLKRDEESLGRITGRGAARVPRAVAGRRG
ncbi:MAG TPA: hypothetical protein VNF49_14150, partial [Candidatus Binataceae bacterium]|nr:hypothetical protein [Candidatus Binataceae bacterium]